MHDDAATSDGKQANVDQTDTTPRQWTSLELLDGRCEAIIVHADEVYRLRCTRNDKLILTK